MHEWWDNVLLFLEEVMAQRVSACDITKGFYLRTTTFRLLLDHDVMHFGQWALNLRSSTRLHVELYQLRAKPIRLHTANAA